MSLQKPGELLLKTNQRNEKKACLGMLKNKGGGSKNVLLPLLELNKLCFDLYTVFPCFNKLLHLSPIFSAK